MASMGKVLETATSRTEEGSRPADRAAASIRARIPARREAVSDTARYFLTIDCSAGSDAFTSAAFGPFGSSFR